MGVDNNIEPNNHIQCSQCQQFFQNEDEKVRHLIKEHGNIFSLEPQRIQQGQCTCTSCGKHFGNHEALQLHQKVHKENAEHEITPVQLPNAEDNGEQQKLETLMTIKSEAKTIQTSNEQLLFQSTAAARKVGLTKIRLEDCFRCDACSCIYLEEKDYQKHMRNFHQDPFKKRQQKKMCRSCCRNCNCNRECGHLIGPKTTNRTNLHVDIKNRWRKMVSTQVSPTKTLPTIKTEPELDDPEDLLDDPEDLLDYSHLLSQVEVRLKTEPEDDKEQMLKY